MIHSLSTAAASFTWHTFILVFGAFALALVVFAGACAIFAAYQLNAAAEYTKPFRDELARAAEEIAEADARLAEAERARLEAGSGRPGPIAARVEELRANDRSPDTRQDAPGALPGRRLNPTPCRFCRRVRDALRNAWGHS